MKRTKASRRWMSIVVDVLISVCILVGAILGMSRFVKLSVVFYLLALLFGVRRQWCIGALEELFCATGHAPEDPASLGGTEANGTDDGGGED